MSKWNGECLLLLRLRHTSRSIGGLGGGKIAIPIRNRHSVYMENPVPFDTGIDSRLSRSISAFQSIVCDFCSFSSQSLIETNASCIFLRTLSFSTSSSRYWYLKISHMLHTNESQKRSQCCYCNDLHFAVSPLQFSIEEKRFADCTSIREQWLAISYMSALRRYWFRICYALFKYLLFIRFESIMEMRVECGDDIVNMKRNMCSSANFHQYSCCWYIFWEARLIGLFDWLWLLFVLSYFEMGDCCASW